MTRYIYFCPECRKHYVEYLGLCWYSFSTDLTEETNEIKVKKKQQSRSYTTQVHLKWKTCTECRNEKEKHITITEV